MGERRERYRDGKRKRGEGRMKERRRGRSEIRHTRGIGKIEVEMNGKEEE